MFNYIFKGPSLIKNTNEPSLHDLIYKYYRTHVNPDLARQYTNDYLNEIIKGTQ